MIKMIMAQPKGLYFCKIDVSAVSCSLITPWGSEAKSKRQEMRFAIYYGFDLVGQTMLSMQDSFKNRSSTHMPLGDLIMW